MELKSALYLIPVNISDTPLEDVIPAGNIAIIKEIKHFIVENIRTARRFLKKCDRSIDIGELTFYELNGHTDLREVSSYLEALRKGMPIGVMSEAGCPGVADPGSLPVSIAMQEGLKVIPLVGPSSILLSLMASGMNGQSFAFNGYLPVDEKDRERKIRDLESLSSKHGTTQIFIETPYRNVKMMESLVKTLHPTTRLCVACDVTNRENEKIVTKSVSQWRTSDIKLEKMPTVFLINAR